MKSFHIKSVFIGIGMGAILTAIITMIYMAGPNPYNKLTDKEIIAKAKILGMVEANSSFIRSSQSDAKLENDVIDNTVDTDTKISQNSKNTSANTQINPTSQPIVNPTAKPAAQPTVNPTTKPAAQPTEQPTAKPNPTIQPNPQELQLMLNVVKGDTSEMVADKLIKVKLILNKKEFIDELTKMGLTMEINIGQFKIKKGTAIKKIINIITSPR